MALIAHFEDRRLVRRVLRGDQQSAALFFDTYFARLYRFAALRVRDEGAVEDIVQETLIKAMRNLGGYRGEAALFTWLCQICRNQISDFYQKAKRASEVIVPLEDSMELRAALETISNDAFTDEVEQLSMNRIIQLTLDHLPERYSEVLELKYIEGLSVDEIAGRLESSATAIQSLLARARTAFRQVFEDLAGEVSVAARNESGQPT